MKKFYFTPLSILLFLSLSLNAQTPYCASKSLSPWEDWIANVKLNTLDNASEKFRDYATFGYSNYLDKTTILVRGQTYPLSITPGLSYSGRLPNVKCRVWIDFNQNNAFEQNELVLEKSNANPLTANVLVPTTAVTGSTRMRVSLINDANFYPTPCGVFDKGEVEDYTINIQVAPIGLPNLSLSYLQLKDNRNQFQPFCCNALTRGSFAGGSNGSIFPFSGSVRGSNLPPTPISVKVKSYISTDDVIDANDYAFGQYTLTILRNNGNDYLEESGYKIGDGQIPPNFPLGNYKLLVKIDADNVLAESDENDNVSVSDIKIIADAPDLTLGRFTISTPSVQLGTPVGLSYDIRNIGSQNATSVFTTNIYVSRDNALSADDLLITKNSFTGLAIGNLTIPTTATIPTTFAVGQYYLILKIDADNQIAESFEDNNVLASETTFTVTTNNSTPDLGCSYRNGGFTVDRSLTFYEAVVTNQGQGGSTPTVLKVYISRDSAYPTSGRLLSNFAVSAIAPLGNQQFGGSANLTDTFEVNRRYFYIAVVDPDNTVMESNENNNVQIVEFTPKPATTSPICTNSLLTNGGYENGLTGWFGGGQITTSANSGANAIKICVDQQRILQTVPAQAGKTYLLRAFAKTDDATGRTMGFINFKFLSSAYVPLLDRTLGGFNATTYTNVLASPALGLDAYSLAAPAGTAFVEISVTKSGGMGCVYIDDWCLTSTATTDPCVNDFISPTFTNCPTAARTITLPSGQTSTVVNWTVPTATDDCGIPSVIQATNYQNGGSYGVGTLGITYEAKDSKGNLGSCSFTINVVSSTAGSTADIAVSINSTPSVFSPFSTLNMAIGAKNVGTQATTNVKIEFKYPTGTVSGGTAIPSVGTWNEWCSGGIQCFTWTIPSLAANATATLNLPLYVLNPTSPIIATAKLLSSTPVDGNLANNTASVTINKATTAPGIATLSRQAPTQFLPVVVQSIEPTLVETEVFLNVGSIVEKELEFNIYNTMGKPIRTEKRQITKGENRLQFDVFNLPSGMYLIVPNTTNARNVPMKFIKL